MEIKGEEEAFGDKFTGGVAMGGLGEDEMTAGDMEGEEGEGFTKESEEDWEEFMTVRAIEAENGTMDKVTGNGERGFFEFAVFAEEGAAKVGTTVIHAEDAGKGHVGGGGIDEATPKDCPEVGGGDEVEGGFDEDKPKGGGDAVKDAVIAGAEFLAGAFDGVDFGKGFDEFFEEDDGDEEGKADGDDVDIVEEVFKKVGEKSTPKDGEEEGGERFGVLIVPELPEEHPAKNADAGEENGLENV